MAGLEQAVLRAMLAALHDDTRPVRLPDGIEENELLALARHHRLSPGLSTVTFDGVSPALQAAFSQDRLVTLGRAMLFRGALLELIAALRAAAVPTIVLKGMAYEVLVYPIAGTRPATDIDLLVRPEARPAAFRVFRALGFVPVIGGPGFAEPDYHEVTFQRDDIYVDLHFALVPIARCSIDYDALWSASVALPVGGATALTLSRPHCLLHHALHMAVHHFDVPAIYLLDVDRLVAEGDGADQVADIANRWGCLRPWHTTMALTLAFIPDAGAVGRGLSAGHASLAAALPASSCARAARVVRDYGRRQSLPRLEQLRRKLEHFDNNRDMVRYFALQGRRMLQERLHGLGAKRTAAERLGWR